MKNLTVIKNQTFAMERALYNLSDALVEDCRFAGEEDGESFLKECRNITVKNCFMDLRYPMWHVDNIEISGCEMTVNCRAALWYDNGVKIIDTKMHGIKALRECSDISLDGVDAVSPEFCWRCKKIDIKDSSITSEYAFFESEDITAEGLNFGGKYSFQYVKNLKIKNSVLNTKDAFWHAHNVTVEDSEVNGEYLGWYSDGLTLIRCKISGTQPLCYCKNLTLIDCTMTGCDLSFENSEVNADVKGEITSVKNPRKGKIVADSIGEIITEHAVYPVDGQIVIRGKKD